MSLYEQITLDMKEAMRTHDKDTLSTIRLLKSAIDLKRINEKLTEVTDEVVIDVASKQVKTHRESIIEFTKAGLSIEELNKIIDEVFLLVKPESKKDIGRIMKELTPKVKGRADMKEVSKIINNKLGA